MNETPDEPRRPDDLGPSGQMDLNAPPPDTEEDDDDDFDESVYDLSGKQRRFLSGRRLIAVGAAAVVLLGGAAFLLVGGGDDDNDDPSTGNSGDNEMADAAFEYAECMREHGIDMPDPVITDDGRGVQIEGGGPGGPGEEPSQQDMAEMEAAEEECGPILEEAQGQGEQLTPEELAELRDQAHAMAECMRGKGWEEFPEPEVDENGGMGVAIEADSGLPEPGDPDFEQFEEDQQACDEEAGLPGPDSEAERNTEEGDA